MAQSSRHRLITREDFAEHVSEEMLMRLLEEHPEVRIAVLSAREERQREVEVAEVATGAKRARTEEEEALREMENAERARAEAELPRQTAVRMVKATTRAAFSAMAYVPPTPHLFVPSGFNAYRPWQTDYEAKLVLRDPTAHISMTWTEVYARNLLFLSFYVECT